MKGEAKFRFIFKMKIGIYAAASERISDKYIKAVESYGENLAKEGHSLIYGGGATGLMGAAARGFRRVNGEVIGVVPRFMHEFEPIFDDCTEIVETDTMAERKEFIEKECDQFVILPGGIGTLDEFFQALTLRELRRHNKHIVIYNIDNYFTKLLEYMDYCIEEGFIRDNVRNYYEVININTAK